MDARLKHAMFLALFAAGCREASAAPGKTTAEERTEGLTAEIANGSLVVRRAGALVTLRNEGTRATAAEQASLALAGDATVAWETTDVETLATARGLVRIVGGGMKVTTSPPPSEEREEESARHRCVAHDDGAEGFVVVCRLEPGAWRIGAANLLAEKPDEGVSVVTTAKGTLVRLELPHRDEVAAAVVGYMEGQMAHVVRAEGSWVGEGAGTLALGSASRMQPGAFPIRHHIPRPMTAKPSMAD